MEFDRFKQDTFKPGMDPPKSAPGSVDTWSYSTIKKFEECPYSVYLSKVEKMPRAESNAADRGTRIHQEAEDYLIGNDDKLPESLSKFTTDFEMLRGMYNEGIVEVEEDWGFTREWNICEWEDDDIWGKMKLDSFINFPDDCATVIDFKTGRKFGNEIKHTDQGIFYTVGAFMRYPQEVNAVQVEFWYLDKGVKLVKYYTREEGTYLIRNVERRATALTTATTFEPTPSKETCRWCDHNINDNCDFAVR